MHLRVDFGFFNNAEMLDEYAVYSLIYLKAVRHKEFVLNIITAMVLQNLPIPGWGTWRGRILAGDRRG